MKEKNNTTQDKCISLAEVMTLLRIKRKTILQKQWDEVASRFSQPEKKIFLCDRDCLSDFEFPK